VKKENTPETFANASNELTGTTIINKMKKIKTYLKEAYNELVHKVTWPSVVQLQSSAIVVMVGSVILALIVLVMDLAFRNGMQFIYEMLY
jgi:preprotein translocase subunit SecE